MIFFRLVIMLLVISLVILGIFFVITKNKKYLFIIRSIINYSAYAGVILGLIYLALRVLHL
ncbi:MAG: hypothetical protein O2833_04360 [Proteobacteria bacterium]|jgi:hypothetical protein|nr:hypothetical protein [Pseudomonadota bacterium]